MYFFKKKINLGDSGYQPWLMVPYRTERGNERFNSKHSQRKSIVERTIGLLKAGFRCLLRARELHYQPKKVVQIVKVCAMLHNLSLDYNVAFEDNRPCL